MSETPREPLVTVVIPSYNRLPLLLEAIASVAAQTYARWELLVADDGSTDGTASAVREMRNPRVRAVALDRIGQMGVLRNAGAEAGSGDYIAFLDSDDLWLPGKLAAQIDALRESGARWSYTAFELMDEKKRPIPMRSGVFRALSGHIAPDVVDMRTGVMISTLVVERRLFDEVGRFNTDRRFEARHDLELTMRLAVQAEAVAVADTLVRVREHAERYTAHLSVPFERTVQVYDMFLARNPAPELARLARRRRGGMLAPAAGQRLARGHLRVGLRQLVRALLDGVGVRGVLAGALHGARTGRRTG